MKKFVLCGRKGTDRTETTHENICQIWAKKIRREDNWFRLLFYFESLGFSSSCLCIFKLVFSLLFKSAFNRVRTIINSNYIWSFFFMSSINLGIMFIFIITVNLLPKASVVFLFLQWMNIRVGRKKFFFNFYKVSEDPLASEGIQHDLVILYWKKWKNLRNTFLWHSTWSE